MNQFKSGTLIVIVATVVIAALMLLTGRDAKPPSNTESEVTIVKNDTAVLEETKTDSKISVSEDSSNSIEESNPGVEKITLVSETQPIEIKAPEGPYNNTVNDTEATETEVIDIVNTQASDSSDTENSETTKEVIKAESINTMTTSTQHDLLKDLIQPIWMDQKLGDFKSIEKGEVVFKMMPTNPDGLQGEDPKKVITSKSDKFAPTTVSADYNYQQMPMYNGGYYIAPMPAYLMQSMLPSSGLDKAQ